MAPRKAFISNDAPLNDRVGRPWSVPLTGQADRLSTRGG
jgi:hypothetical protein